MAAQSGSCVAEGQATNRPPLFNGTNYTFWKTRMRIYIISVDFKLWKTILTGPHTPTKVVDGLVVSKVEEEYDDEDAKLIEYDAKAMNLLYCALEPNEFNRISACNSAKEIWDMLEVTHVGTHQVKKTKINMLVQNYEMFRMESSETIGEMYIRFTNIVNGLRSLGKIYTNSELVSKILRCLPLSWGPKKTAIEEAKDTDVLPLEQLIGSLMTYELELKFTKEEGDKKKKTIAFKSTTNVEEESSDSSEGEEKDEVAMVARKFRKFLRKKKNPFKRKPYKGEPSKEKEKEKEKEREQPICYECKKPGHYRTECPQLKKGWKKNFKKKAMMATWSDSEDSSSEEEQSKEVANICFMAQEEQEVASSSYTFDELQDAFDELMHEYENVLLQNKELKGKNHDSSSKDDTHLREKFMNLIVENDRLTNEMITLKIENKNLKTEMEKIKPFVEKFTYSSEKLNLLLNSQKAVFNKAGLGFKTENQQKYFKNFFVPSSTTITCYCCGRLGHKSFQCNRRLNRNVKMIWVPKGTNTNPKGPKMTWVPKTRK